MRIKLFAFFLFLLLIFSSCNNAHFSGNKNLNNDVSLKINLSISADVKTIQPDLDMNVASYDITGSGPNGTSFNLTGISNDVVTISNLVSGSWTIVVYAKNSDNAIIASGDASVIVVSGSTVTADITVYPLDGNGTLSLVVTWNTELTSPSIEATLQPNGGSVETITFNISTNSASYVDSSIPAGYYQLIMKLFDGATQVWGQVEAVRIIEGETTEGNFEVGGSSSSSSSVSSSSSIDGETFGIYIESIPVDVIWDTDTALDIWQDDDGSADVSDISIETGEGTKSWKLEGLGAWMGIGVRVSPLDNLRDLSAFNGLNGYLRFMYKGTKGFKVGIKSGGSTPQEVWITSDTLLLHSAYGLTLDGNWCEVKIPTVAFSLLGIDFSQIEQYFMFVSNADLGYEVGDVHYIDGLYYSIPSSSSSSSYSSSSTSSSISSSSSVPSSSSSSSSISSSSSSSSSLSSVAGIYGIYSDSLPLAINWGSDAVMDILELSGTDTASVYDLTTSPPASDSPNYWYIIGDDYEFEFSVRVEPFNSTNTVDLSDYNYINFTYKNDLPWYGGFKIGIASTGTNNIGWVKYTQLASYGLVQDNAWHTVKVPLSEFTKETSDFEGATVYHGADLENVQKYFIMRGDNYTDYLIDDKHFIDNIYFSVD